MGSGMGMACDGQLEEMNVPRPVPVPEFVWRELLMIFWWDWSVSWKWYEEQKTKTEFSLLRTATWGSVEVARTVARVAFWFADLVLECGSLCSLRKVEKLEVLILKHS